MVYHGFAWVEVLLSFVKDFKYYPVRHAQTGNYTTQSGRIYIHSASLASAAFP